MPEEGLEVPVDKSNLGLHFGFFGGLICGGPLEGRYFAGELILPKANDDQLVAGSSGSQEKFLRCRKLLARGPAAAR